MQYKKIGNSKVPAIGQGTGGVYNENIIRMGLEFGMTLIDTAESYGNEEIVGKAIKGQRDNVFISTKFSPGHNGYDDVIKACNASLKRLGTDYIDLYSMYYPNPHIPAEETLGALVRLVSDGKIKYYGVCNTFNPQNCRGIISAIQNEYNLFDRSVENLFLYCEKNQISIIAYSPLLDFYQLNPDSMLWLQEIGMKYQKPLSQLILNWLISHKPVIAIPRSNNKDHIEKNAQASDFMLEQEDIERIDRLFQPEIVYLNPEQIDITLTTDRFPVTKEDAMTCEKWVVKPQDLDLTDYKPIKVRMATYGQYEIIEGGLRYWAWIIQKGEPIPAIIKDRYNLNLKDEAESANAQES